MCFYLSARSGISSSHGRKLPMAFVKVSCIIPGILELCAIRFSSVGWSLFENFDKALQIWVEEFFLNSVDSAGFWREYCNCPNVSLPQIPFDCPHLFCSCVLRRIWRRWILYQMGRAQLRLLRNHCTHSFPKIALWRSFDASVVERSQWSGNFRVGCGWHKQ